MSSMLAVFILSAFFVFYVIAGYPLLLGLLTRCFARPVHKKPELRSVSVLIAVRNGEPWVRAKLNSILALDFPKDLMEIIVISDGSDDRTEEIVSQFRPQGVALVCVKAGGKSAALTAGMQHAKNEILVLTDVRQELAPDSLRQLIACFADPAVGAVSGELVIRDPESHAEANVGLYWRYETWIRSRLSALDSMLGATGPFYALRRHLAVPIPADVLLDDVYLPLPGFFAGYRLLVENSARAFDYPTSLHTEFRRKVRTLAGNYQILRFYPALLGPRNRLWFHYVSYKIGRLLLPYALVLVLVSSPAIPTPWSTPAIILQSLLYLLALLDVVVPEAWPVKRITSPLCTFVVLMAAAVCATAIFFVPARKLWKPTHTRSTPTA